MQLLLLMPMFCSVFLTALNNDMHDFFPLADIVGRGNAFSRIFFLFTMKKFWAKVSGKKL